MRVKNIKRVLIIRLRRLGDVVAITPCTRAVKETFPNAYLSVLVEKEAEGILVGNSYVDEIIVFDRQAVNGAGSWKAFLKELEFLSSLRERGFDLVINLHGGPRSALQTLFTGAQYKLGGFPHWHPWNWVYNIRVRPEREVIGKDVRECHIVERHLSTLKNAGIETQNSSLVMVVAEEARISLDKLLRERGVQEGREIVTIHPAARNGLKRWRAERFAELADRLIERFGVTVALASGPKEMEAAKQVRARMQREAIDLAGLTTVQELAALLERSTLFIGLDGGPAHIAAAVGTPLVVLYGPTTDTWRPWSENAVVLRSRIACLGCRRSCPYGSPRCLEEISVEEVFGAILSMNHGLRFGSMMS